MGMSGLCVRTPTGAVERISSNRSVWLGAISWSQPHVRRDVKEANQSVVDSKLCASSLRAHGVEHRCADRGEAATQIISPRCRRVWNILMQTGAQNRHVRRELTWEVWPEQCEAGSALLLRM